MFLIKFSHGQDWQLIVEYALVTAETYEIACEKITKKYSDATNFRCLNIQ